ncbi:MAG: DUF503 domain-containing protein [Candidatus Aminicenantes bacterium]|nr:DUF503 domain-containing protein [Candidatus Aminicenantes bacterium]MCJ7486294.1 DUF503 domain-containing protein [Candidatus Aminicenantes bacterium]TFG58405.1 MAG: DUF503 domain-containing protein [Candidatus Aminicenantes bacterium]
MVVGVLKLELFFPYAHSLKDKRRILHGFKDRVRKRYNVALAEVDFQDKWQRALLGIVSLNSQQAIVEEILGHVLADALNLQEAEVSGQEIRYV